MDADESSVPSNVLFRYPWRVPFDINTPEAGACGDCNFAIGDEVWLKPPTPSCTKQWALGEVTGVISRHTVCVNGVPRHVRDVRKRRHGRELAQHGGRRHQGGLAARVNDQHIPYAGSSGDLPLVPSEGHGEEANAGRYAIQEDPVQPDANADLEIELEPAEQHAEHGLRSCDNRGDVC
ncbi:hypothetical protein EB796_018494 [Bugula neritina]|uniref:Uncharacterized protein n=1 Tax=Bugula neritina TaxID=10212 RepID=A0A7J7JAY0_BUGNE|nr:hypothetical protein EB796_018494 [Bugula neritina]